jgi:hypothetical protein
MEFDHVARHHQPDLPPGLQKLSGRGSQAAGVGLITVAGNESWNLKARILKQEF